jgi:hypothetical protein
VDGLVDPSKLYPGWEQQGRLCNIGMAGNGMTVFLLGTETRSLCKNAGEKPAFGVVDQRNATVPYVFSP